MDVFQKYFENISSGEEMVDYKFKNLNINTARDIIDTMLEGVFELFAKLISLIFRGIGWLLKLIVQAISQGLNNHKKTMK